jgi:Domain of unknown function (DUF6487)
VKCPACTIDMSEGFLYVRGIGGALFWSKSGTASFFSRRDLEQVDLKKASVRPIGAQAVLQAWRCGKCGVLVFRSVADGAT